MDHRGNRTIAILTLLVIVWILVYWVWEPRAEREPIVTFPDPFVTSHIQDTAPEPLPQDPLVAQPEPNQPQLPEPDAPVDTFGEPPFRWYTVRANDTAERIAARELGSAQHWRAIARANPLKDITRLKTGERIKIPLDPSNPQGRSEDPPPSTPPSVVEYTVRSGDTLSGIAQQFYGSASPGLIDHIFNANRDRLRNRNDLRVGQMLILPPKPTATD